MPGMMRNLNVAGAGLLSLCLMLPTLAPAQDIPPVSGPSAARPPLPVPIRPDLSMPPLPTIPDQTGIPAATITDLPAARVPGAVAGDEPARLASDRASLIFAPGAATLPAGTDAVLADLVVRLKARPTERLELRAQAAGVPDRANDGRRVALDRAKAVRDRLVALGIDPLRLLIFAEGATAPTDRIDLVIHP